MLYNVKITQSLECRVEGASLADAMKNIVDINRSRNLFAEMSDYVDTEYEVKPIITRSDENV